MVGTSDPLNKPKLRAKDPDLPDPVVYSFDTEADMLRAWYDYINSIDADIITGYNIYGFDMEYIEERMRYDKEEVEEEKAHPDEDNPPQRKRRRKKRIRFHRLGKLLADQSNLRSHKFQNNAYGKKNYRLPSTPGRIQLDALEAIRRDVTCKFRSYRLDAVSDTILGLRKVDVHYKEITPLFEGTDADRARLGEYNLMDVVLPDMLLEDKAYVYRFIEEARVCNVPMLWLLIKGQQVKVMAQILRETIQEDLLIPMNRKFQIDPNKRQNRFKGAIVIDPIAGYYIDCVMVLDFQSLYPSIMRRWNLGFTTWVPPGPLRARLRQGVDYEVAPNGHAFLKKEVKEGLLPRILNYLLTTRARAKKDMAAAAKKYGKNSPEYKKQDGRQNALKVSANSVYGFTGALVGRLPCLAISSAVTGYGRYLIEETKATVEALNPDKYRVIYGDTDSVMVRLVGVTNVQEALDIGDVMEAACDKIFQKPIKIVKEKAFYPYALFTKKRYAGLHWERSEFPYYINSKGLISVRRDNALFASDLFGNCLDTIYGYNDAFDNVLKFVESIYPASERGYVPVVDGTTGALLEVRRDDELVAREKGDIYAKICSDTGEVLRPGWVMRRDPLTGTEKKARVGVGVDTIYTCILDEDREIEHIEEHRDASLAERTRGLVYATFDRETGEVVRPGWVKKRIASTGKEWVEMVGDSVGAAIQTVQDTRERLYGGEIPLDMLTISKAFSREPSEYVAKQPHVELALRMAKRDAGSAPKVGDRVPFVVVKRGFKAALCEKAEDPAYVLEHGVPVDYDYYDSRQLKKPVTQLFAPILAKQDHREYMPPVEEDEDEMEDYVEEEEEETAFDRMRKASADIRTDSVVLAERKLFPQITRRRVEFKGASVLPPSSSLPPNNEDRAKRRRLNAFDLLLGHAKREAQGS
jgi:DNA polymerase elongation subunit (family B)